MSPLPPRPIRILLVSGLEIIRAGLRKLLDDSPLLRVIHESESCGAAAALPPGEQSDIILFDCDFCADTCLDTLPKLLATIKGARVLILTSIRNPVLYHQAFRLGARGLVFKEEPVEVLYKAIQRVHAGEFWLNDLALTSIFNEAYPSGGAKGSGPEETKVGSLTGREREVITLICEGIKNKQIAEQLFISEATVHHHLTSIYDKLGVSGRSKLMIFAYRNELAAPPAGRPDWPVPSDRPPRKAEARTPGRPSTR